MTLSQISYASLQQLQDHDAGTQSSVTTDTARLTQFGIRSTALIDTLTGETFAPWIRTEYIRASNEAVTATKLTLPYRMLVLTSITLADSDSTSLTVDTDIRGYPRAHAPIDYLQVLDSQYDLTTAASGLDDDLTIVGVWGWHNEYASAWVASGDTVTTTALTATATSLIVSDADGVSGEGYLPRFSAGQLLKIENEYVAVTAVNTSSNTLTIVRGVRGSTAATHVITTPIYFWTPLPDIVRACALMTTFAYDRRSQSSGVSFETVRAGGRDYAIPSEAMDILYQYDTIKTRVIK